MSAHLKKLLAIYRHALLDIGLRANALLHFSDEPHGIFIKNTKSAFLFDELICSSHPFAFSFLDEKEEMALKGTIEKGLETDLSKEQLDLKLTKIHDRAKYIKQEQGLDILYLAFGFLTWYESDDLQTPRYAPLFLVPVYLKSDGSCFKLSYSGTKINPNFILHAKLTHDFDILLPELEEDSLVKNTQKINLNAYFAAIEKALAHQASWQLERDKIALGFFSFTKFELYYDLSDEAWPEKNKPSLHSLFQKLWVTGFEKDGAVLDKINENENENENEKLNLILPADPSQIKAIKAAKAGASFVIQGPPGTGKSQTIANLIAQALADNKRVLFVTEKKAALDVVEQRLTHCQLGEALLVLHSTKTNKRKLLNSLEKALFESASSFNDDKANDEDEASIFSAELLKEYEKAIKAPIGKLNVSFYSAFNRALYYKNALKEKNTELVNLPKTNFLLSRWDEKHYQYASSLMLEMGDFIDAYSEAFKSPFSSTKLLTCSPSLELKAEKYLRELVDSHCQLLPLIDTFLRQFAQEPKEASSSELEHNFRLILFLERRPLEANWPLLLKLSTAKCLIFLALAEKGAKLQQQEKTLKRVFFEPALKQDWYKIRGIFIRANHKAYKWWRFLSPRFHWASRQYASFRKKKESVSLIDCLEEIDLLIEYQLNQRSFNKTLQPYQAIFGAKAGCEKINWDENLFIFSWLAQYHQLSKHKNLISLCPSFFDEPTGVFFSVKERGRLIGLFNKREKAICQLTKVLKLDKAQFNAFLDSETISTELMKGLDALYALCRFNRLAKKLTQAGLSDWAFLAAHWSKGGEELNKAFHHCFYQALCEKTYQQQAALCHFDRIAHEECMANFSNNKKQQLEYSQQKIRTQIGSRLPSLYAQGEMAVLRRAFQQKKHTFSIRTLFQQAGRTIQAIKPVFMMSPLSIANYLAPGALEFDLVIFDEASQIRATEGLGSLLRAKQVILVGDPEQLAPSQFFKSTRHLLPQVGLQHEFDEHLADGGESLLNLFLTNGAPRCLLQWHYRSEHPSLIEVSNQAFYRNQLIFFPASGVGIEARGLELCYLPHTHYDRGKSRTNQEEAHAIAKAVIAHAKKNPNQSLGVVTFSQAQREVILTEIERLRKIHSDCDTFFEPFFGTAPFFVKNLEHVQGDERDVIFISIGYGKTHEGKLSSQFGPLNSDGGERRLNVLITRARLMMQVFTNFSSKDLPLTDTSPRGVQVLKQFLAFAENKLIESENKSVNTTSELANSKDIDFERKVETFKKDSQKLHFFKTALLLELEKLGYLIDTKCEYAGIDIGVKDPAHPKRYLLAICCDVFNEADTFLQENNQMKIEMLKKRGWHIHRVWCIDWFRHPENELLRITKAIDERFNYFNDLDRLNKRAELKPLFDPYLTSFSEDSTDFKKHLIESE